MDNRVIPLCKAEENMNERECELTILREQCAVLEEQVYKIITELDEEKKEKVEEYIMLGLRLKNGISNADFAARFGKELPENIFAKAKKLQENGLCDIINDRISLTNNGMLISNQIINYFLEELI